MDHLTGSPLCARTRPHLLSTPGPVATWALATVSKGKQEWKMLVSAVVLVPVMGVILFLIGSSEVPGVDDIDLKEAFVLNLAKVAVWAQLRSQVRGSSSSSRAPFRSRPAWEEACKLRPSGPLPAPGRAVHVVVTSKTPGLVALAA